MQNKFTKKFALNTEKSRELSIHSKCLEYRQYEMWQKEWINFSFLSLISTFIDIWKDADVDVKKKENLCIVMEHKHTQARMEMKEQWMTEWDERDDNLTKKEEIARENENKS